MMLSFDDNNIVGDRVYSFRVVSSVVMKTEIGRREAGITDEPRNPKKCLVNNGKAKVPPKMSLIRLKAHYDRLCLPRGQLTVCSKTLTIQNSLCHLHERCPSFQETRICLINKYQHF